MALAPCQDSPVLRVMLLNRVKGIQSRHIKSMELGMTNIRRSNTKIRAERAKMNNMARIKGKETGRRKSTGIPKMK